MVAWGHAYYGGDSSAVQERLKNVQQIQASGHAFAAILGDGSVVTWGDGGLGGLRQMRQIQTSREAGGGSGNTVQDQLQNVHQIQSSDGAFAAVQTTGSLVTWGVTERDRSVC